MDWSGSMLLKKILLVVVMALVPSSAFASISLVQSAKVLPAGSSGTLAFPSNVTSGSILIVGIGGFTISSVPPPTDSLLSTYKLILSGNQSGNAFTYLYVGIAGSSAANTVSFSGVSGTNTLVSIEEWSGVGGVSSFNSIAVTSSSYSLPNVSSPITPAAGVVVSLLCNVGGSFTFSYPGGTIRQQGTPTNGLGVAIGDQTVAQQSPSSLTTVAWTASGSGQTSAIAIILLPPTSGGGGGTVANSGYAQ